MRDVKRTILRDCQVRQEISSRLLSLVCRRFSIKIIIGLIIATAAGYIMAAESAPGFDTSGLEKIGVDPGALSQQQVKDLLSAQSSKGPPSPGAEEKPDESKVSSQAPMPTEAKISFIENLMSGRVTGPATGNLMQFGYDVFRRPVSTFAPVTNVPVGSDYIVGPGDTFTVTLWGRVNAQYAVEIDRNGQIALRVVGVLSVSGMSL